MRHAAFEAFVDLSFSPIALFACMAIGAGIRRADLGGERRARNAEAVIRSVIVHHVGALGHVAVGAKAARGPRRVKKMLRRVVDLGLMASAAQGVALQAKLRAVPIVAVAANDAGSVHLALEKRAIDVDLVSDLTVVEVKQLVEGRDTVAIVEASALAP